MQTRRTMLTGAAAAAVLPGVIAAPSSASAQPFPFPFRPGLGGDSGEIAAGLARAAATGQPLTLAAGRTYRVGARGWPGFSARVGGTLIIEGNGATIHLASPAVQPVLPEAGAMTPCLFRFVGNGRVIVRNLKLVMGGWRVSGMAFTGPQVDVQGCSFSSSFNRSDPSDEYGVMMFGVPAATIAGNRFDRCGGAVYAGHTSPGFGARNVTIRNNEARGLRADFAVGIMKNATIADNVVDGCFSGVAIGGYDRNRTFASDVTVVRNQISNFRAHGIQTDVVGSGRKIGGRPRNITLADNVIRSGLRPDSTAIYLLNVDGAVVRGNRADAVNYGVMLDESTGVEVTGNIINAAPAAPGPGVRITGSRGAAITLSDNSLTGFAEGVTVTASTGVRLGRNRIAAKRRAVQVDSVSQVLGF